MGRKAARLCGGGSIPANLARELTLQHPPAGVFDDSVLEWSDVQGPSRGGVRAARIPTGRVLQFAEGMGKKVSTNAFVRRSTWKKDVLGGGTSYKFVCQRAAPRKATRKLPTHVEAAVQKKKRRGIAQLKGNQSLLKCCCPARFFVTVWGDDAVVYLTNPEHQHPEEVAMHKFIDPWVSELVREEWLAGNKGVDDILRKIEKRVWDHLLTNSSRTKAQWQAAWDSGEEAPPREYLTDKKYVTQLLRFLENDASLLLPDEAASVQLWIDQNEDDVFFYQPGVPVEQGKPENVRAQP